MGSLTATTRVGSPPVRSFNQAHGNSRCGSSGSAPSCPPYKSSRFYRPPRFDCPFVARAKPISRRSETRGTLAPAVPRPFGTHSNSAGRTLLALLHAGDSSFQLGPLPGDSTVITPPYKETHRHRLSSPTSSTDVTPTDSPSFITLNVEKFLVGASDEASTSASEASLSSPTPEESSHRLSEPLGDMLAKELCKVGLQLEALADETVATKTEHEAMNKREQLKVVSTQLHELMTATTRELISTRKESDRVTKLERPPSVPTEVYHLLLFNFLAEEARRFYDESSLVDTQPSKTLAL